MSERFKITNVRLSFPSLFQRAEFEGDVGKYEATFLFPKETPEGKKLHKLLSGKIEAAIKEAKIKISSDKRCLKDGDNFEYDSHQGMWSFKASANRRPNVLNRDKSPLTEEDEVVYAGCYVNAVVDIWVQNNKWGKRVNANLYGVQFLKDGEPFGMGPTDVTDDFDEVKDDAEDFDDGEL
jgi:hypothetical protein